MSRATLLRLFCTIWVVYVFHFNADGPGTDRFVYLTRSIVEHGSLNIDAFQGKTGDAVSAGGHEYIVANPGLPLLAAPAWGVAYLVYRQWPLTSQFRQAPVHYFLAHLVCCAATTAPLAALTAVGLAWLVYRRTRETWRALLAALVYAFGSIAFYYATKLDQNIVIAFVALAVFILLYEPFGALLRRPVLWAATMGFVAGMGILVDYSVVPLLCCAVVPVWRRTRGTAVWAVLCGAAAVPIAGLALYQYHAFGNALLPAHAHSALAVAHAVRLPCAPADTWLGFTSPNLSRVMDYLLLPGQGFFAYMPYAILALWYSVRASKAAVPLRAPERWWLYSVMAAYVLFISLFQMSECPIFGPRYLMPIVPFVCLLLALYLPRRWSWAAVSLVGWGVLANVAGAEMGVGSANILRTVAAWLFRGPWLPVLSWIGSEASGIQIHRADPIHVSSAGLFLLMAAMVAVIWLPPILRRRDADA